MLKQTIQEKTLIEQNAEQVRQQLEDALKKALAEKLSTVQKVEKEKKKVE